MLASFHRASEVHPYAGGCELTSIVRPQSVAREALVGCQHAAISVLGSGQIEEEGNLQARYGRQLEVTRATSVQPLYGGFRPIPFAGFGLCNS